MAAYSSTHFLNMIRLKEGLKNAAGSIIHRSCACPAFHSRKAPEHPAGHSGRKEHEAPVDYRRYRLTKKDFARQGAAGACVCALAAFTFYKSLAVFAVLLPVGIIVYPLSQRNRLRDERIWQLTLQFREAILTLSGFLNAGYSVENAFFDTIPELKRMYGGNAMIVREFTLITKGLRLNRPVEPLLADLAERSSSEDIRNFAEVFALAKRSGGNMKDIIDNTAGIIRDKTSVTEEIRNMTASRRYEQNIMNLLPFALIIYISMTSEGFLDVMYETLPGRIVMTFCLLLTCVSYLLSKKLLDIRV